VSEQIADRDLSLGGHHLAVRHDRRSSIRRNEPADRIAERDLSFLEQNHDCDARQRFGLRRDPEHRVGRHATSALLIGPAQRAFVHDLPVAQHEPHRARDPVTVHLLLQIRVDASEALGGETVVPTPR
jgi:hypothetical protein